MSIYDMYEVRQNADSFRPQLTEIYGSFSEGFDTMDLVRAKARTDLQRSSLLPHRVVLSLRLQGRRRRHCAAASAAMKYCGMC
jgi:hypothetical protein